MKNEGACVLVYQCQAALNLKCNRRAKNQTVKFELKYEKALKKVFLIMEFEVNNN